MAINAYVGLQGSGKSYEFVSGPMLDAILQGRRVVTNVAGIDQQLVHDYLLEKHQVRSDALGNIIHVTNDRIFESQFFPDEEKPDVESVVQPGDLVAVDEAWRFWGADSGKLSHEHMQFFRMHRHYVHPVTLVSCDVVLMTQDITGLHRSVRNVIEFAFRMQKHKSLGLNSRYRVEIYEGWKINSKTRIDDRQKKYDPEIFPLYQSYAGGQGSEKAIDKRQNILAHRTLWVYAASTLLLLLVGVYFAWKFFHRNQDVPKLQEVKSGTAAAQTPSTPPAPHFSSTWRYAGEYEASGMRWLVVVDASGRLRAVSPSTFQLSGVALIGDVDGEKVTRWSGPIVKPAAPSFTPGVK